MKTQLPWLRMAVVVMILITATLAATGCREWRAYYQRPSAQPLGTHIDPVWQAQERNAEMSDFVIHVHEFRDFNSELLNHAGEEHLMSIAARLKKGQDARVIVERSKTSPREETTYKYPVHTNVELDMRRRDMVVRLLGAMGVPDAEVRTIIGPRLTPGMSAAEGERTLRETGMTGAGDAFGGFFIGTQRY